MLRFFLMGTLALAQEGGKIYSESCAQCHDGAVERAPARFMLALLSREAITRSLDDGVMAAQGKVLTPAARAAVAGFLTNRTEKDNERFLAAGGCEGAGTVGGAAWSQWGLNGTNTRFQTAADAGIAAAAVPKLGLAWAVALPGESAARSQPAVKDGRLFVGSAGGVVLALDARTGCRNWSFPADFGIRGGIVAGDAVYFADGRTNVYALDPKSGRRLWRTRIGEHPTAVTTGTPQLHNGVLYFGLSSAEEMTARDPKYPCCTFRGSVVALEAGTGKIRWRTHTVPEPKPTRKNSAGVQMYGPSGAGVWTTPTIDAAKGMLYVSTGDNFSDPVTRTSDAVMGLRMATGEIVWSRQLTEGDAYTTACGGANKANCPEANGPDHDFGQPPILVTLAGGKRSLVLGQKSGVVHALDPDNQGEVRWQTRVAEGGALGGIQWGSAADASKIYVAIGDIRFQSPGVASPLKGGGVVALSLADGKKIWAAAPPVCGDRPGCSPAQSAAVSGIPGAVFAGSLDGRLRGYSTETGAVIWEFDTAREFETMNGVKAKGGSIDAQGPVIVNGFVYTNSGFGSWGGRPGNVLLAFTVKN
ncbi:MAG: cytochrome C oxidase Cbb3 [Acidobacteria bacterium]|nr:cytochrome C oxidase Cbb3 [Acidobacteriota bacterium]